MSKQELLDSVKISLLRAGGVDNWIWYSESIQQWEEDNDCEIEDDSDLLNALENGGVDNWDWYGESLDHYFSWVDHVEEFYGTDEFLDYDDYATKMERCDDDKDETVEPTNEISEIKYTHLILADKIADFTDSENVNHIYNKVITSEGFWSGLGTFEGREIFNYAKTRTQKYIEDNNLPFTSEIFFTKAQEIYLSKFVESDTFINHLVQIIFEESK